MKALVARHGEKTMARKRSRRNRLPRESVGIINPYKMTDENIVEEEMKALDYEQPTFAIPGLDEVLEGTDREAEQMMRIYKL